MFCSNCGKEFEGNFCPFCGAPAPKELRETKCPDCGHLRGEGELFCSMCGRKFDSATYNFNRTDNDDRNRFGDANRGAAYFYGSNPNANNRNGNNAYNANDARNANRANNYGNSDNGNNASRGNDFGNGNGGNNAYARADVNAGNTHTGNVQVGNIHGNADTGNVYAGAGVSRGDSVFIRRAFGQDEIEIHIFGRKNNTESLRRMPDKNKTNRGLTASF